MTFIYKHKKTGKIIELKRPIRGKDKENYVLVSWIRNMMIQASKVFKK